VSDDESFRVTDRRGRSEPAPAREGPPAPELETNPGPGSTGSHDVPDLDAGPATLSGLFMMFASSALVGLGAAPDPGSETPRVDLGQARTAIDVLLLLREKTQGNRTEPESRLLDGILYDLQVRFISTARGRSAAAKPPS